MRQGRILAIAALAGLLAIASAGLYIRSSGSGYTPLHGDYDQVYKYCTRVFRPDLAEPDTAANTSNLPEALKPGEYALEGGGTLYLLDRDMFQIVLPSQLQLVRHFGDGVDARSASDRPRAIIGCTRAHLAKAMKVYGFRLPPGAKTGE